MLFSSHLNQQISKDSTQLAGGIVLQAVDPSDVLREAVSPLRRVASLLVVLLFNQTVTETYATDETCREVSCPVLFSRKWAGDVK